MLAIQNLTLGEGEHAIRIEKEVVAILSINQKGQKGVLILPWAENSEHISNPHKGYNKAQNIYTDYQGNVYKPLAMIHTHPDGIGPLTRQTDEGIAASWGHIMPFYVMDKISYVQYYPSVGESGGTTDLYRPENPISLFPK